MEESMKKLIALSVILIILIMTTSCSGIGNRVDKDSNYSETATDTAFTLIDSGSRLTIYRDNKTDVMYLVYHSPKKGGITVMLNDNGLPLTYTNWLSK